MATTEICYVCKKAKPRNKLQEEPYVGADGTRQVLVCPEHLNKGVLPEPPSEQVD